MRKATHLTDGDPVKRCPPVFATAAILIIAGCSALVPEQYRWPADLPPLEIFESAYEADAGNARMQSKEEYLSWIYRFYKGWIAYAVGWLDIEAGVVASVPADRRSAVGERLAKLGSDIAAEWAKASPERVVYKQTLAAWGEVLTEAVNRGEVEMLLGRVETDLGALFAGTISVDDIATERYYPDLDDGDPFAR